MFTWRAYLHSYLPFTRHRKLHWHQIMAAVRAQRDGFELPMVHVAHLHDGPHVRIVYRVVRRRVIQLQVNLALSALIA